MKFASYLFLTLFAIASAIPAHAQSAKVYTLLSGGTTTVNPFTTNIFVIAGATNVFGNPGSSTTITGSNLIMTVAEFDNVGLTWQYQSVAATNGATTLRIYKSFNNAATFETVPSFSWALSSSAPNLTEIKTIATNLFCQGATHLAFTVENVSTNGYLTNALLQINDKSPKFGSRSAIQ